MTGSGDLKKWAEAGKAAAGAMAKARKAQPGGWVQVTNVVSQFPGSTWIGIPRAGTLSVLFQPGSGHDQAGILHAGGGGRIVPLAPGQSSVPVGEGDLILYQLASPATDSITLVYSLD
jgi:hypothetical protein